MAIKTPFVNQQHGRMIESQKERRRYYENVHL